MWAQQNISGRILDKQTLKGVEFAAVSLKNKDIGSYTDFNGKFNLEEVNATDTLVIRHVAYGKEYVPLSYFLKDSLFLINPQTLTISELIVKPKKGKIYKIGFANLGSKTSFTSFKGFEVTTLIKDEEFKESFIKEIYLSVKEENNSSYYIKSHIYSNDNGKPGAEVIFENIHKISNVKEKIVIDLSKNMILFPAEGLFVGIEWVGMISNDKLDVNGKSVISPKIKTTEKNIESITYYRHWDRPWKDISILFEKPKVNALIGLTVIK